MRYSALILGFAFGLAAVPALAEEEGLRLPPIDHAATLEECSTCHLAFPPQMLPARSWQKIMASLADHFGEDASVAEEVRVAIANYLVSQAADAPTTEGGGRFLRRLDPATTPLRITDMPFWQRAHDEISAAKFESPQVKSRANCVACHKTADKGEFFEE